MIFTDVHQQEEEKKIIDQGVDELEKLEFEDDVEEVHIKADHIILFFLPQRIRDAYTKLKDKQGGFWYA